MTNLLRRLFLAAIPLALSACGESTIKPPRTVPVTGTVNFQGKPAAGIRVTLHPMFDIGPVAFTPLGETDPKGRFSLSTGAPDNGAPVGDYVVTFEKMQIVSDKSTSFLETEMDEWKGKYGDPDRSRFDVTITEGENELDPFNLE
jgi:hypothetical protein